MRYLGILVGISFALLVLSGCQKTKAPANSAAPQGTSATGGAAHGAPVTEMPADMGPSAVPPAPNTAGGVVSEMPATASPGRRPFAEYMSKMTPEERKQWESMTDAERAKKRDEIMRGKQ